MRLKSLFALLPTLGLLCTAGPACDTTAAHTVKKAVPPLPKLGFYLGGLKPWGETLAEELGPAIELSGSRGETLAFTVRTEAGPCFEPQLKLTTATGASSLPRLETRFYEILPFVTAHASYRGVKPGTFWDPLLQKSRFCPEKGPVWLLGEIRIPADAARGAYEGRFSTGASELPLKLKVWGLTMPEVPSVPLYSELTTWFALLGHYGKWHEGEAELGRKYIQKMLENRMVPTKHGIRPVPLGLPGAKMAELATVDGHPSPDAYETAVLKPLPEWAKVPVPFGQTLDPEKPETAAYITKVGAAVEHDGWMSRAYAYLWDEPEKADLPKLKKLAALVRADAPKIKILVTATPPPPKDELNALVDIWVPIVDELDKLPANRIAELQKAGKEVWTYASCVSHGCYNDTDSGAPDWVIDRPGAHIRSQGWLAQRYGLNALLYYSVDNGYQFYAKGRDPWLDLWDFSGNGDGTLFYPGRKGQHGLTEETPVESLRLKLWRQSSFDADYVQLLKNADKKPDWWPSRLTQLVRSAHDWEHSDKPYRELREQIGDYLDTLAQPEGKKP